jgi:hypothetical protein
MNVQQVTHIRKPHPFSPHEAIAAYGYTDQFGRFVVAGREQFIKWLRANNITAFVSKGYNYLTQQHEVALCEVRSNGRINYLQTVADNTWTDNLLSLPQC